MGAGILTRRRVRCCCTEGTEEMQELSAATFSGLLDLASASLGGRVLGASDEFFASASNLISPGRGVFVEGKFTDRGKWMDGWESRRRRGPGHDWCILELGVKGTIVGFDIDTNHFLGNHPPFASVDGVQAPRAASLDELRRLSWTELLAQAPLRPGSQNLFSAAPSEPVSHVRLNIYPDGGVARFRVFGTASAEWDRVDPDAETRPRLSGDWVELAAATHGGLALACSDAFFGPMNNLLLPGRAENMGGGWETRRKRAPGHDWIVVRLGARGIPGLIEVDTNHFKGNYPDRCSIDGIDAPGASISELVGSPNWRTLLGQVPLSAHTRHFFDRELDSREPVSHVRLNIFPDGGVSRLRVWGSRA